MVNKTVMSVNMDCNKCKRMALRSVTEIDGIDSIEFNMKNKTVTVVGEADPVCMANQLRRRFKCAELISHGPPPKPKEDNKPKEKEDSKKGSASNPTQTKKPEEKPPDQAPVIHYLPYPIHSGYDAAPHCYCGYSPCSCRSDINVYVVNEDPPACTIC